ncbi:collagen alpha-6(VI) chain [Alligator sinensis]|uniref:Collagen alpha-6(VI) chain n=1 Tax=Alligator sinensis TaxID=38654 RepID=A0A1U7SXW4_ALLSI|nr:collagen alpha-6(VI) chain [Alligator sinensis]
MKMLLTLFLLFIGIQTSKNQDTAPESADIVFLIDSSDTLGKKAFPALKNVMIKIINNLPVAPNKYRIALAQYSDDLQNEFLVDRYKTKTLMINHIRKNLVFKGGSIRTGNALQKVRATYFKEPIHPSDKPQILVVVTSGTSEDDVKQAANVLKRSGVKIIAVGLQKASPEELQSMATQEFFYEYPTIRNLSEFSQNIPMIIKEVIQADVNGIIPTPTVDLETVEVCERDSISDVVFIVDEGAPRANFEHVKTFLENTVSLLDVKKDCIRTGLVTYSSEPHVISLLNAETNRADILNKIQGLSSRAGKANMGAALKVTREKVFVEYAGSRKTQSVNQIATLITHRASDDHVSEAARDLRRTGVTVFAIGVENANETQLTQIASYPQPQYVTTLKKFVDLTKEDTNRNFRKKLFNQIQNKLYVQTERSKDLKTGCMDTEEADIYLLIDGSTSINIPDFKDIKEFVKEVIEMFNIGPNNVRFGVVQYSHKIEREFTLDQYQKKGDLVRAIDNVRQIYGDTYTGKALEYMQPLFTEAKEQRRVPCHLIVLTDGEAHDRVKEPADKLRANQVNVYAIGIKGANKTQLEEISASKARTYFVNDFDSLKVIKDELVQKICSKEACKEMKADIMFLVDSSGSIGYENYAKMKRFMRELVNKSDIGTERVQVGVVQFSDVPREEFQLNQYSTKSEIVSAIDRMNLINQNTLTGNALTFVAQYFQPSKGARPNVKKILILITDGEAQDAVKEPATALRQDGIIIYSVGVFNAKKTQLEEISGKPEFVFYVENFDLMKRIEDNIIFGVCSPPEDCKRIQRLDIVFVIDGSGSIDETEYKTMKDFMISLVRKSDVGPDGVQFGAVKYSDDPTTNFYLNTYSTKSEIIKAIQDDERIGGATYTASALKHSHTLFIKVRGSRMNEGVPQVLIVITDGESNDKQELPDEAQKLRDKGIIIYAVGIEAANYDELLMMAGVENKCFYVDTFDGLKDISFNLSKEVCDDTKPPCKIKGSLVFLVDSSSIPMTQFSEMQDFMKEVVNYVNSSEHLRVGLAQYSSIYKEELKPDDSENKIAVQNTIERMKREVEDEIKPYFGAALKKVKYYLELIGHESIHENFTRLLIIADGNSRDDVAGPAQILRNIGIKIYAIGVGQINHPALTQVVGTSDKWKYSVTDVNQLRSLKKRLADDFCEKDKAICFVDIVLGFDISSQQRGHNLFHGQSQLKAYLHEILRALTSPSSVSCSKETGAQSSVAVQVKNTDKLVSAKFRIDSQEILNSLTNVVVNGSSHLDVSFLELLWQTFENKSDDQRRSKVMLVFSDGLDDEVEVLEQKSEELRKKGLDALITIALEGVSNIHELQFIEFGKGFEYRTQLNIGMSNIMNLLSKYVNAVAERKCCCVFCKCSGNRGPAGQPGSKREKGLPGPKGSPGHSGEEGDPGPRGPTGPRGEIGTQGCQGVKGVKGSQGIGGQKGEEGDGGVDGIDGEQGSYGFPGKKGERGDDGYQGSSGPKGPPGERGKKGFRGDPGTPGLDNDIRGPKGSKGEQGRQGDRGPKGSAGSPGSRNSLGPAGQKGQPGIPGVKGDPGFDGSNGDQGFRGPQGPGGIQGVKGDPGSQGNKGPQGIPGSEGSKGNPGSPGVRGSKGETGEPGPKGLVGPYGSRGMQGEDGIDIQGRVGRKGVKGQNGCPGDTGMQGEMGDAGIPGEPGPKGNVGNMGTAGNAGKIGDPGDPGHRGRRGPRGPKGESSFPECGLINYVRNHSRCWSGKPECPVYPTELVFALDLSEDVTPQIFQRMKDIVISIVTDTRTRDSNCPIGARVAVMQYGSHTHYVIRFSEFYNKKHFIQEVKNLSHQRSKTVRHIGSAMRFIARHVFKRTLQAPNVRKIAVFFSNGPSADASSINTAVLEYRAFDIIPVVIAFNDVPNVNQAFKMDDTGKFQVINIDPEGNYIPFLQPFLLCTLCYDKCNPDASCMLPEPSPPQTYVDAAFILDSSWKMSSDEFETVKVFLSKALDAFDISSYPVISATGDRVAMVSHATPGFKPRTHKSPVKMEFDLVTHSSKLLMQNHIKNYLQQLNGEAALGYTIEWVMENIFSEAPNPRDNKFIIVISAGETSSWDKEMLKEALMTAKCQGYALFVISLRPLCNDEELEELASIPLEQHLVQLGRMHKPDLGYIERFMKAFVRLLRSSINRYPPEELRTPCETTSFPRPSPSVTHAEGSAEEYVSDAYLAAVGHLFSMLQADLHDDFLDTDFISTAYEDSATGNKTEHADITNSSNEDCI